MKTLTINGLLFTDQPPTKHGHWIYNNGTDKRWCYFSTFLDKEKECRVHDTGTDEERKSCEFGGYWHELIPRQKFAEEVEKAYVAGHKSAVNGSIMLPVNVLANMYAKLVSEGKEPSV